MSKHGRVYSGYQLDIGVGAFKRAVVTHWNAVTTAVKRKCRVNVTGGGDGALTNGGKTRCKKRRN